MGKLTVREISSAGLIAAVYTVLALAFLPISFGVYQVRVAEALTVLPFLTRAAIPGLYVGALLANIFGGMGWVDIVVGPLITLAAAFLTRSVRHIPAGKGSLVMAALPPLMMWVGGIWLLSGAQLSTRTVSGVALSIIAIATASISARKSSGSKPARLIQWIASPLLLLVAAFLMTTTTDPKLIAIGAALLVAALVTFVILTNSIRDGSSPNLLIAPLPPVVLNALGVSVYLAPILGFNYWFSVQMIGLGQLIACYLIGLNLLKILGKRQIFI